MSKHTGEEDSCAEECNHGTLEVTCHWQAERQNILEEFYEILKLLIFLL